MADQKQRRKTPTKFISFEIALNEYELEIESVVSLLKDGYLVAFGKFDNDFTGNDQRERLRNCDIEPFVWRGDYSWEFHFHNFSLTNEDLQSYSKIRFVRKEFERVISLEFAPKKIKARWYNWEIIALQICAYMHNKELPSTKGAWFNAVLSTIPYFQTGAKPDYSVMDDHLGIVWESLNSNKVDWNQYVMGG